MYFNLQTSPSLHTCMYLLCIFLIQRYSENGVELCCIFYLKLKQKKTNTTNKQTFCLTKNILLVACILRTGFEKVNKYALIILYLYFCVCRTLSEHPAVIGIYE